MSDTLVMAAAWLAVLAITVSAVLFGQGARVPGRPPRDARAARNRRLGTAVSISGPIAVVLLALAVGTLTDAWLIMAVIAFAAVGIVALAGLVLAPH
ncbi:MAG: hypothetical protein ACR2J5_03845 [Geodermatophilaceae bacterium]|jgi:archaellum biogenesis protein FlaJ (TadC family)